MSSEPSSAPGPDALGGSRAELRASLTNPCLLNLICGQFTVERAYQVMENARLPGGYGHFCVAVTFAVGFAIGLLTLWSPPPRWKWVGRWAAGLSYLLLVVGSVGLLVALFNDISVARDARATRP